MLKACKNCVCLMLALLIDLLQKAAALDPDHAPTCFGTGQSLVRAGL